MRWHKLILLTVLLFPARLIYAQQNETEEDDTNRKFERVEIEASYPGGLEAWKKFLLKNLKAEVPVNNNAPIGQYTVIVQFIVDREGAVSDIKALTNHGYGMEEEVIRIIKKSGTWSPATQGGRTVKAYRKQPVTFLVEDDNISITTASSVLYTNTDNPLSIGIEKVKPEDIQLTLVQGNGNIVNEGGGRFVIRAKKPGRIVIDIYNSKKNKKISSMSFEVINK